MRTKSSITWLLQRLTLFSVFFAVCYAENATAKLLPFANISARAQVLTGENVVIAGFVITSTATTTKQVVIRGIGPSLGGRSGSRADSTLTPSAAIGPLADPTLTLHGPNGLIYSNNNWRDDPNQQNAIAATGLQPSNDLESAIIWTLPPGSYTVILAGNNGGTGVGLLEVYDIAGAAKIGNLSSRAQVGTGDNVLIGGVIIRTSTRAVVRAIGPSLTQHGIQGALQNPTLELRDAQGAQLAFNDNWGTNNPDVVSEINYLGLGPGNANESAILAPLAAGHYTAIVRGVNNTTGVGLVELFALADATYPRIFQAWSDADNLIGVEDIHVTRARHDLLWQVEVSFGYNWVDGNGQTTIDYTSERIDQNGIIHYSIPTLRSLNPNIKILVQVTLVSLAGDRLSLDHAWWKRGAGTYPNNRVPAPGGGFLLDLNNASLRIHVANQARELMQTGQFDGVMLDSVDTGTSWLQPLLTEVRNAIGENGLIIVNANCEPLDPLELNQINGVFMECGQIEYGPYRDWQYAKASLDHNEFHTRAPKVNCLENWYVTSRTHWSDLMRMRATTALSMTHSNGYALFGDPNELSAVDHLHNWYDPFWSNHSLGVPLGTYTTMAGNYADRREFKNGTVVWNAAANTPITINFPEMRKSLKTQSISTQHTLTGIDGDIYLINY